MRCVSCYEGIPCQTNLSENTEYLNATHTKHIVYMCIYIYIHICISLSFLSLSLYIYIYIYIHMYMCMYTYTHNYTHVYTHICTCGRFPRPASTKNTKLNTLCVRIEQHIPYQSKTHRGYMKQTHTSHYAKKTYYAFLARFGVCIGVTLRGYVLCCPLPKRYNCIDARKHTQSIP